MVKRPLSSLVSTCPSALAPASDKASDVPSSSVLGVSHFLNPGHSLHPPLQLFTLEMRPSSLAQPSMAQAPCRPTFSFPQLWSPSPLGNPIVDVEKGKTFDNLFLQLYSMRDATIASRNSAQCYETPWMGGEFGGEWLHVYAWLGPFAGRLKLSQYCL